jgi:1-deoxy-D-xylulose-5-phosphate synthase
VRYPRGAARDVSLDDVGSGLKARQILAATDDPEVCILAVGKMVEAAEEAAAALADEGVSTSLWDVRVVRPLDHAMIADAVGHRLVVTVEDGVRIGGAGAFIADVIATKANGRPAPPVVVLGLPSEYIPAASPAAIHARLGLDAAGIAASVRSALASARR